MNKKAIIIALVAVVVVAGSYFIFAKQSSAPITDQTKQIAPVTYTTPSSFKPSFLQCSPSELRTPGTGNTAPSVITVFGLENGKCHYASKVDTYSYTATNGETIKYGGGIIDCKVPMKVITSDFFENGILGQNGYCSYKE